MCNRAAAGTANSASASLALFGKIHFSTDSIVNCAVCDFFLFSRSDLASHSVDLHLSLCLYIKKSQWCRFTVTPASELTACPCVKLSSCDLDFTDTTNHTEHFLSFSAAANPLKKKKKSTSTTTTTPTPTSTTTPTPTPPTTTTTTIFTITTQATTTVL